MSERCNACRFWLEGAGATDRKAPIFGLGACRLKPPELITGLVGTDGSGPRSAAETAKLGQATRYPVTAGTDWCGRFEAHRPGPLVVEFPDAMVEFGHRTFQSSRPARD